MAKEYSIVWIFIQYFVYPFIRLFSLLGNCEWCCYKHSRTSFVWTQVFTCLGCRSLRVVLLGHLVNSRLPICRTVRLHSSQQCLRVLGFSKSWSTFTVWLFDSSCANTYKVVSHCGFSWHFAGHLWCHSSFHVIYFFISVRYLKGRMR